MFKHCGTCSSTKPVAEFGKNAKANDGLFFQCKTCRSSCLKVLYSKKPDEFRRRADKWVSKVENAEKERSARLEHYQRNKERVALVGAAWWARNKSKRALYDAKYKARKCHATPSWLSSEHIAKIGLFYVLSEKLSRITGVKMNVDHIVPMQGKTVCGLHVPWNLQVIPEIENFSKGNRLC